LSLSSAKLLGPPTTDGFTLRIPLSGGSTLSAIVVPERASPHVNLPLSSVWAQIRIPSCRLSNAQVEPISGEYRWTPNRCRLLTEKKYAIFLQIDGGSLSSPVMITIPGAPHSIARFASFKDDDNRLGHLSGVLTVDGALEESTDVLQYRIYWGQSETEKIKNFHGLSNFVGSLNTFAGGGFRNVFDNECIMNDCHWKFLKVISHRRRGLGRIQHQETGDCMCQPSNTKVMTVMTCPTPILSMDHANAESLHSDCLFALEKRLMPDATLQLRMRNVKNFECLCHIPVQMTTIGPDGQVVPKTQGSKSRQLLVGKWCDSSTFQYYEDVEAPEAPTKGYCEWTSRPIDVIDDAMALDASANGQTGGDPNINVTSNFILMDSSGGESWVPDWQKAPAWLVGSNVSLDRADVSYINTVQKDHTHAVWVDMQHFGGLYDTHALIRGLRQNGATYEKEDCLVVQPRLRFAESTNCCPSSCSSSRRLKRFECNISAEELDCDYQDLPPKEPYSDNRWTLGLSMWQRLGQWF
jgi:hypothetical protein